MKSQDPLFLPNFCQGHTVLLTIMLSELFAFILVLVPLGNEGYSWHYVKYNFFSNLAFVSLFIQSIALLSIAVLCGQRHWLKELNDDRLAAVLSYLFILLITIIVSECAWWIDESIRQINSPFTFLHHQLLFNHLMISMLIVGTVMGLGYVAKLWRKSIAVLIFVMIMLATFILSEIISFFSATGELRPDAAQHQLFLLRNLSISAIVSAIVLRYLYMQYHWKKNMVNHADARFQALQARIRPHFLFNSMNTIASLIYVDAEKAEQAVEDLSELFRASLGDIKEGIKLEEEMQLCQQYIRIEGLRFESRLNVVWHIEQLPKDALLPRLCLQPLLENAVYYGIQPLEEGGTIQVIGMFDGKNIRIDVENPFVEQTAKHKGLGMAQQNVRARLQAFYQNHAGLQITSKTDRYSVTLYFPYITNVKQL